MSYDPDIWTKFLENCRAEGIELKIFDGRTVQDFELIVTEWAGDPDFAGFADGGYEKIFVTTDECAGAFADRDLLRKLTELVRAGRDTRLHLSYDPWPQGVAVSLPDLERALTIGAGA